MNRLFLIGWHLKKLFNTSTSTKSKEKKIPRQVLVLGFHLYSPHLEESKLYVSLEKIMNPLGNCIRRKLECPYQLKEKDFNKSQGK